MKLYKTNKEKQNYLFLLSLIIVIPLLYIFLSPRLSSYFNPLKRISLWNSLKEDIIKNNEINSRLFWQFREFYYPGNITLNFNRLPPQQFDPVLKKLNVKFIEKLFIYPFLIYRSDKILSLEALVNTDIINDLITNSDFKLNNKILNKDSSLVYFLDSDKKEVKIVFVKPREDMVKTNGFFDKKKNKKLLKNTHWLVISKIKLD